jgi:hypothetical protein
MPKKASVLKVAAMPDNDNSVSAHFFQSSPGQNYKRTKVGRVCQSPLLPGMRDNGCWLITFQKNLFFAMECSGYN